MRSDDLSRVGKIINRMTEAIQQMADKIAVLLGAIREAFQTLSTALSTPVIQNVRFGFATNSSSSHSFVYLTEPVPDHDVLPRTADREFGWEDFTLSGMLDKLFYVLVMRVGEGALWNAGDDRLESRLVAATTEYGKKFPELTAEDFEDAVQGYVDHDSMGIITEDMARDPHVIVFGGNDNNDPSGMRRAFLENNAWRVDWENTPVFDEEAALIPPAARIRIGVCAECGEPNFSHGWKCSHTRCYSCHAPGGEQHHQGCESRGRADKVGDCSYCGNAHGTQHADSCTMSGEVENK